MVETKESHIINLTENLVERLQIFHQSPRFILNGGIEEEVVKKVYPNVEFVNRGRVDLILGIIDFSENLDWTMPLINWRKIIKPNGVLLFGMINGELDIQAVGDYLIQLGFVNVVVDCEENVTYGHAMGPKEVSIKVNQIRRVN